MFVTALVIKLLLWYLCFFFLSLLFYVNVILKKKNTFLVSFFLYHVKIFYFFQLRLCGAEKVASELKCYCDFFLFLFSIWLQIFSHMPEDSTAPPVPPPRINPRKRQPITISKRPARVYQALSHELYQHTESNYQPLLAWLSPSSSSLSHAVFAEHTVDFLKMLFLNILINSFYSLKRLVPQRTYRVISWHFRNRIYCFFCVCVCVRQSSYYILQNLEFVC